MILQALTQYYEDLVDQGKIALPGWSKTRINYALCIDEQGELKQVIPLLEDRGEGKRPQPQQFDLPSPVKRTVGVVPNFLWDNSTYLLGVDAKDKPERSIKCFEEARKFHLEILGPCKSEAACGIKKYFEKWNPSEAYTNGVLKDELDSIISGGNLTFRINGRFAFQDHEIKTVWQEHYDNSEGDKQQCLVTGKTDTIEAVHPSIKGVENTQSSGAAIVSFNAPAFCSYGQEQNYNAPVGKYAAFAYTSALNYLLADRENVQKIGDTTVVCWAEGAKSQYQALTCAALFGRKSDDLSEDDLRDAVRRLANGLPVPERDLDPKKPFYILGLAPNAARISVRFFYRGNFGDLMKNINAHHERMNIVRPSFEQYETISLSAMLQETVKVYKNYKDKTPNPVMAGAVARAIVTGGLYPASLLEQIMLRIRAERRINRKKAAVIKAYYLRNSSDGCPKEVLTVSLNEKSTNLAYTLGRLFSVLEAVQEAANPGINSTIKDKYFNSASSTPAAIFPLLNNLSQKHLRKLSSGKRIWYEKQIVELIGLLGEEYPSRLTLPQQGSFYLGYYHQTQKRYEKKEVK